MSSHMRKISDIVMIANIHTGGSKHVLGLSLLSEKNNNEPRHDKTKKMSVRPAKTQISLGIRPI